MIQKIFFSSIINIEIINYNFKIEVNQNFFLSRKLKNISKYAQYSLTREIFENMQKKVFSMKSKC